MGAQWQSCVWWANKSSEGQSQGLSSLIGAHKGRTSKTNLGQNFKEEIFKCGSQKRLEIARGYLR